MRGRLVLVTLALLGGPLASAATAQDAARPTLAAFDWLAGEWQRTTSRGTAIERWSRVSDGTMEGIAEVTVAGSTRVTEQLRLLHLGDQVFYLAKPGESPMPTAFLLVGWSDSSATFENRGHDFPQRIIYRRVGADSLVARIEGPRGAAGSWGGIDFGFRRRAPAPR